MYGKITLHFISTASTLVHIRLTWQPLLSGKKKRHNVYTEPESLSKICEDHPKGISCRCMGKSNCIYLDSINFLHKINLAGQASHHQEDGYDLTNVRDWNQVAQVKGKKLGLEGD